MDNVNRRIVLARRPQGMVNPQDFRLEEAAIPVPAKGEALVRVIYLTLDPYMRGMMSEGDSYDDPVPLGGVMVGGTVGEVIESRDASLQAGDSGITLAWTRRFPNPHGQGLPAEIEVRPLYTLDDFPPSDSIERFKALDGQA